MYGVFFVAKSKRKEKHVKDKKSGNDFFRSYSIDFHMLDPYVIMYRISANRAPNRLGGHSLGCFPLFVDRHGISRPLSFSQAQDAK